MKYLSILFFSFLVLHGNSQNWELIQEDEIYYYSRTDSVGIVNSMRVDSSYSIGDSIYYVLHDNYLDNIDTCNFTDTESSALEGDVLNFNGIWNNDDSLCAYHLNSIGSVLGKTILNAGNGEYILHPGIKLIKTLAHEGDSWNFTTDLIASVVLEFEELNFGIIDSVKLIEVYTLDSVFVYAIKISKNHGLISYPFGENDSFENTGTHSTSIGFSSEDFSTSLSLGVEDIQVYRYFKWYVNDFNIVGVNATIKLEVHSIDTIDEEEVYHCTLIGRKHHFNYENDVSYYTTFVNEDFIYKPHSIFGPSLSAPGEIAPMSMIFPFYDISGFYGGGYLDSNSIGFFNLNGSSIYYEYDQNSPFLIESIIDTTDTFILKGSYWDGEGDNFNTYLSATSNVLNSAEVFIGDYLHHNHFLMVFSKERGLAYCGWEWFETGHGFELIGSMIDGSQWGDIPSNSVLLSIDEKKQESVAFKVYPNPFNDHIILNNQENGNVQLKIFSILGKEMSSIELPMGENRIDMSSYKGNAFILKVISDKGIFTKKIIRMRD